MRATLHNGRKGSSGVYTAKHNDRQFNMQHAPHIKQEQSKSNIYWHYMQDIRPNMTFEQVEADFYEKHFADGLRVKNESYKKHGDYKHMQNMNEYRKAARSCPEEVILMIGKTGDTISPTMLRNICKEQIMWENATFPNVKTLNFSIHTDEKGAVHAHIRRVWLGHDKQGNEVVGQNKALAEMGIKCPQPSKARSKYNNPKQTHTAACRKHLQQLCKIHGIAINTTPKEKGVTGLDLLEYQTHQEEEKLKNLLQARKVLETSADALQNDIRTLQQDKKETSATLLKKQCELAQIQGNIDFNKTQYDMEAAVLKQMKKQREEQAAALEADRKRLEELQNYLDKAEQRRAIELATRQDNEYDDFDDYDDYER